MIFKWQILMSLNMSCMKLKLIPKSISLLKITELDLSDS